MQVEQSLKVVEVVALGMDPPVVVDADTPLREVVHRMRDENSGCALITREDGWPGSSPSATWSRGSSATRTRWNSRSRTG